MNIIPFNGLVEEGKTPIIWVVSNICPVCKYPVKDELICCVGQPHYCLLHKECVPLYDFDGGYPHPKPIPYIIKSKDPGRLQLKNQ